VSRLIPNENTWVGFAPAVADTAAPTAAEITAAVALTEFVITIDASSQGNQLPTPNIATLFETSISGTVQASFTGEFYRDDTTDTAYTTLPRATEGFFIISRFGTAGAAPVATDVVEVWPVKVTSRTDSALTSNDVLRFTVACAVTDVPNEAATVAA